MLLYIKLLIKYYESDKTKMASSYFYWARVYLITLLITLQYNIVFTELKYFDIVSCRCHIHRFIIVSFILNKNLL